MYLPRRPQIEVLHGGCAQGLMWHDGTSKIGLRSGFGHGQGHCFFYDGQTKLDIDF